jgi:hypothetical protein
MFGPSSQSNQAAQSAGFARYATADPLRNLASQGQGFSWMQQQQQQQQNQSPWSTGSGSLPMGQSGSTGGSSFTQYRS